MGSAARPAALVGNNPERRPVGRPSSERSDVSPAKLMSMLLPLSKAMLSSSVQSSTETPMFWHSFRNCWPLLTLPADGVADPDPLTLMLLPLRAAMLRSSEQSAIEMLVLVQLLRNCWPSLMVGVAEAAVLEEVMV